MGSKKVLPAYQIIPNAGIAAQSLPAVLGAMTGTTVIVSNPSNINNQDSIGFQIAWTGNPVGVLAIECSIDGINFDPLSISGLPQPAGGSNRFIVDLAMVPYPLIRVKYTNVSGTGALTAWICGKDLN